MGMEKEGYSKDVVHDSRENLQRMVTAPTILPLVPATSGCGIVGANTICNVPTKPTRPDFTRPNGLPETIQMEDVSVADKTLRVSRISSQC